MLRRVLRRAISGASEGLSTEEEWEPEFGDDLESDDE